LIGRVRHRATFTDLRRRGTRASSGPLTVTFAGEAPPPGDPPPSVPALARVAFAVPRRVGKAVVRNRVRRRLRAIFAEADPDQAPAGAYLVAVRPGVDDLSYRELSEHVQRALTEITKRHARRRSPRRGTGAGPGPTPAGAADPDGPS
jgi:ribonuclease P protein component